ncbi:hypothetical protein [Pseudomonas sp. RIT-PI-AD]|uniref:hypothetical protein n=1 Tax=Pseudomonas sp. RIT-PI-AD TaxID=3035294 RepID=UPI0021DB27FA|nr:hypothetical protein [Pseudomonas sp. RIT-PI-AD]
MSRVQTEESHRIKWATLSHRDGQYEVVTPAGVQPGGLLSVQEDWSFFLEGRLSFEFSTPDYFSDADIGHLTIGIGSITDPESGKPSLQGKGIVIGNLTEYGCNGSCTQTDHPNTVAIESYWATGNCVHGQDTQYPLELQNDVGYRVEIGVSPVSETIRYTLWTKTRQRKWKKLYTAHIHDPFFANSGNRAGWWIGEVFSVHAWSVKFRTIDWSFV